MAAEADDGSGVAEEGPPPPEGQFDVGEAATTTEKELAKLVSSSAEVAAVTEIGMLFCTYQVWPAKPAFIRIMFTARPFHSAGPASLPASLPGLWPVLLGRPSFSDKRAGIVLLLGGSEHLGKVDVHVTDRIRSAWHRHPGSSSLPSAACRPRRPNDAMRRLCGFLFPPSHDWTRIATVLLQIIVALALAFVLFTCHERAIPFGTDRRMNTFVSQFCMVRLRRRARNTNPGGRRVAPGGCLLALEPSLI